MRRLMLATAALVLLAGCTTVYVKTGKTAEDFEKDRAACEIIAAKELAARGLAQT